ncbi:MAG: transcription termination/antitermination protein NusG [Chloroflexota bacterium]|nr:transcription termination/antitermination protein NusG [Chloroflexota bacterium]
MEPEPNALDSVGFEPLEQISPEQLLAAFEGSIPDEVTLEASDETLSPDAEVEVRVPEESRVAEPEDTLEASDETLSPDAEVEVRVPEKASVAETESMELEDIAEGVDLLPDPFEIQLDEETIADTRAWYIIHCYSGYEQKVKHNLEQRIESMEMQDFIFQVVVPTIEEVEIKNGQRRTVERCLYPGYIMVQMILGDDPWYTVRNTPGVTGFVGMGNTPVPLRSEQVQGILHKMEAAAPQVRATFKINQKVRIIEGPFADFIGVVEDIDEQRAKVRILVSFFGRETPVELDFLQVERT